MISYTKIPNDYLEWLYQQELESSDLRILLFIYRKTIGWGKESDKISISQFVTNTKIPRRTIIYSLERLVLSNALVVEKDKGRTNSYRLVQSKTLVLVQSNAQTSAIECQKLVPPIAHTIYTTKETIQKELDNILLKEKLRMKAKTLTKS
jgi:phage replication O-like protein O